jgi:hypothetical protein
MCAPREDAMRHIAIAIALLLTATTAQAAWDPQAFSAEDTLEFLTVEEGEEHWSTVWLVVIDGQVYLRLGSRAAERFEGNASKPKVKIRIAGETYDDVTGESVPDMAEKVNAAMADKYTTDVFARHMAHPLTLRLVPVP